MLLVLGAALVLGPIATGMFAKVASGQQLIDAFAPHLTADALARYDADLEVLRKGAAAVDDVYATQSIATGVHPGVDAYRTQAGAIDERATDLLARIRAAEPDYRQVADIGGFDRVPFLLVVTGLGLGYAGAVLLNGRRQRAGGAVVLALVSAVVLVGYPLVGDLPSGTRAGDRLHSALAPVMTPETVRQQQDDFVVLVHAVGELDTAFGAARKAAASEDLDALVTQWPEVSSDLAALVGAINDNLTNYEALTDLNDLTSAANVSGLVALPWVLVGAGALAAVAALAASPSLSRQRKVRP